MSRPFSKGVKILGNTKPKFDPQKHHRRSLRLKGYDYSEEGAYYVTIVTWHRDCIFGKVIDDEVILSDFGKIADECWRAIPEHFSNVELGTYVIMPNYVHGIIVITNSRRGAAMLRPYEDNPNSHKINVKPGSLSAIVRSYKSAVSYCIHKEYNATGIWQRNYYEHIIRDEKDLQNKTDYINANPSLWNEDEDNPRNVNTQKP